MATIMVGKKEKATRIKADATNYKKNPKLSFGFFIYFIVKPSKNLVLKSPERKRSSCISCR